MFNFWKNIYLSIEKDRVNESFFKRYVFLKSTVVCTADLKIIISEITYTATVVNSWKS